MLRRWLPAVYLCVRAQENLTGAPPGVSGSSLQFVNYACPTAASLGGVRVACACGSAVRGRPLWGPGGILADGGAPRTAMGDSLDAFFACAPGVTSASPSARGGCMRRACREPTREPLCGEQRRILKSSPPPPLPLCLHTPLPHRRVVQVGLRAGRRRWRRRHAPLHRNAAWSAGGAGAAGVLAQPSAAARTGVVRRPRDAFAVAAVFTGTQGGAGAWAHTMRERGGELPPQNAAQR